MNDITPLDGLGGNDSEPEISHWPGDWPGRRFVNLDCVGDPGDWLDLILPSREEVLLGPDPDDESMAENLASAYLEAARELGFPIPSDLGLSKAAERKAAVEDFLGFISEWRRRTVALNQEPRDRET